MLEAKGATLTYRDGESFVSGVSDVSLTVEARRFIGILGPSGSGKSSLLYLLSGMRLVDKGDVSYDNRSFTRMSERERVGLRRTEFGFVFQQHFLIDYLTVMENVMVAAPKQDKACASRAKELLEGLGMGNKMNRFIHELSGGERQRAAIGRAMIHNPRCIFADEPTGLLDRRTSLQVMAMLRGYREHGSLIAVTHNPEILAEADTVITLREGRIAEMENAT